MKTKINYDIQDFSWEAILKSSVELIQNPFNQRIFSIEGKADISILGEDIYIHPVNEKTLLFISLKLSEIVSKFYKQTVIVNVRKSDIIDVFFEKTPNSCC